VHEKDRHPVVPECPDEPGRVPDDLLRGVRLRGLCPDPFLQVNDDKGCCAFLEFQFRHAATMGA
jgi:hypothetical protein